MDRAACPDMGPTRWMSAVSITLTSAAIRVAADRPVAGSPSIPHPGLRWPEHPASTKQRFTARQTKAGSSCKLLWSLSICYISVR